MTKQAFDSIMKPLVDFFGEKQYIGRMHLIFQAVSDLPENNLKWIVKKFIENRNVYEPPVPVDFVEAANQQRSILRNGFGGGPRSDIMDLQHGHGTLEKILSDLGVSSLAEAVEKSKNRGA